MTLRTTRLIGFSVATALVALSAGYQLPSALDAGSDLPDTRFVPIGPTGGQDASKQSNPTTTNKPAKHVGEKKKSTCDKKDVNDKKSELDFIEGYKAARLLILDGRYEAGIQAMHALGHDEHPDVANYIGYSYRKLGDYDQSKHWYELALAADPRHVRTWSYYGMWQAEQGNRLKAEDFLQKVRLICGNETCKEYVELKDVIDGKASY